MLMLSKPGHFSYSRICTENLRFKKIKYGTIVFLSRQHLKQYNCPPQTHSTYQKAIILIFEVLNELHPSNKLNCTTTCFHSIALLK